MQTALNYNKIDQITDGISRSLSTYKLFFNFSFLGFILNLFKSPAKKALNKTLIAVNELEAILSDINSFEKEKVTYLYDHSKKISDAFDIVHDHLQEKNYLNDGEYELLFKAISRKLHRIENVSQKISLQDNKFEKTPDYIKENLSNYSKETLFGKIFKLDSAINFTAWVYFNRG